MYEVCGVPFLVQRPSENNDRRQRDPQWNKASLKDMPIIFVF
jgi:hypothetical protein